MEAIVSALLAAPPKTIGEIEAALRLQLDERWVHDNTFGTFASQPFYVPGDVTSLRAQYRWDMHHSNPPATIDDLRRRQIIWFEVTLASLDEVPLRARFGEPRIAGDVRVYDTWITKAKWLWHGDELPDWAVPQEDAALRVRHLEHVAGLATKEELARAAVEVAPAAARLVLTFATRTKVTIELVPPMRALDLVTTFGWKDALGESAGMHQSSWRIALAKEVHQYGISTAPPRVGPYTCEATLVERPSGPAPPGSRGRPTVQKVLGPEDRVRYLELST